ncbi:hypothetical protein [Pelomonas sp. SE-A7]|nr:hypothetical protein [Pelomonas sp. SE-A7]MDM4767217.1 hypothetical protein [Pelomonas sp. SE-A7]
MPTTYTVGHRSTLGSVWARLLSLLGVQQDQSWPPRQRLAR